MPNIPDRAEWDFCIVLRNNTGWKIDKQIPVDSLKRGIAVNWDSFTLRKNMNIQDACTPTVPISSRWRFRYLSRPFFSLDVFCMKCVVVTCHFTEFSVPLSANKKGQCSSWGDIDPQWNLSAAYRQPFSPHGHDTLHTMSFMACKARHLILVIIWFFPTRPELKASPEALWKSITKCQHRPASTDNSEIWWL